MQICMKCCTNSSIIEETIQKTEVNRCTHCGLIQKKMFLSFFEEKKRYDLHICDDGYRIYMKKVLDTIRNDIKKGRCLDFGCGKMHLLADLLNEEEKSCEYYDITYYPTLPSGLFDTILLIEVFEHLKTPLEELKHLETMLTSHGRIIIMTQPYEPKNLEHWWYFRDVTHVSFIHDKTLEFWDIPFKILRKNRNIFVLERIY